MAYYGPPSTTCSVAVEFLDEEGSLQKKVFHNVTYFQDYSMMSSGTLSLTIDDREPMVKKTLGVTVIESYCIKMEFEKVKSFKIFNVNKTRDSDDFPGDFWKNL